MVRNRAPHITAISLTAVVLAAIAEIDVPRIVLVTTTSVEG